MVFFSRIKTSVFFFFFLAAIKYHQTRVCRNALLDHDLVSSSSKKKQDARLYLEKK